MSVSSAKAVKLAVATLALGFSAVTSAQSNVTIYGLLDMSVGQFQNSGASKVWKAESGNMSTSYLGFKGTEDLGGGLKAKFAFEHFLRVDAGSAGRFNGDAFWARSAYVGLQGEFGSTVIGRNTTPLFVSTLIFNAFGDSFGFAPSIRQYFLGAIVGDTAWNNSIAYSSPNFGGASVNLLANLGEGAAGATGKNLGANGLFFSGPFAATLAWQQVKNGVFPTPAGFAVHAVQAGVSYGQAVRSTRQREDQGHCGCENQLVPVRCVCTHRWRQTVGLLWQRQAHGWQQRCDQQNAELGLRLQPV